MQTWHQEVPFENRDPLVQSIFTEDSIFFDIETTGFSPSNTSLYLIGCVSRRGAVICIDQFFADTPKEEKNLLIAFLEMLGPYRTTITFNGLGFDIPYLKAKYAQCQVADPFARLSSLDIFQSLSGLKKIFKLPNLKQKTIEQFLGIARNDLYSGGELINVYHAYVDSPSEEGRKLLQMHNYEDVLGMVDLLPMLSYSRLFQGDFTVASVEKNNYADYSGAPRRECLITLSHPFDVPKRVSCGAGDFYLTSYRDKTKISIKIYDGELKFFYKNYQDYYYLPMEDTAIHKSVAFYVDKDYRTKAKAATCYSKKTGCFLPQNETIISPYFKLEYHDKTTYFELTDDFLQNPSALKPYVVHVMSCLARLGQ